jgi:hypothetical protein
MKKIKKKVLVSPDVGLTSVVIRQPHLTSQLTVGRQSLTTKSTEVYNVKKVDNIDRLA